MASAIKIKFIIALIATQLLGATQTNAQTTSQTSTHSPLAASAPATATLTTPAATTIQAIALFNGKAMLAVNNNKAKIIAQGKSYQGVKLIHSSTEFATIEVNGQQQEITLNSGAILSQPLAAKSPPKTEIQIWADDMGFFRDTGSINGQALEFLVDTGANIVVLSSQQAQRIGLDYSQGKQTFATTASGVSPMHTIELEKISFQGIELNNVQAGIIKGSYPHVPLLGMSYLKELEMNRSGNMMTLKKR